MGLTRPRAHQLQDAVFKEACVAISTSNVTLSGGAPATVDGVSVAVADRILVTGQTSGAENGIYRVTVVGSGSNGTWVRTSDADSNDIKAGMSVMVTEGTTYADTVWKLTTDDPITVGTTALTFERSSAYAFGTVTVDGTSLVADQVGDTLTISAGNNISYTSVTGTDTFTIAVADAPTFTGNLTAGNLTTAGTMQADLVRNREQRYTTSNMMKFNQLYTGGASGSYFTQNEYQKIVTITPSGDNQNYQVSGRILAQNAGEIQTINFTAALRSGTLPDLDWSITYTEEHNGTAHFKPQLWTKETTTAGFIFAIQKISSGSLYGTVTVDLDIIPRTSSQLDNVTVNTTQDSEQTSIDAGYTANDMTLVRSIDGDNIDISAHDGSSNGLELGGTLVTATAAELNLLDGVTATTTELNYVDGVTSSIQTQLDAKAGNAFKTLSVSGQSDIVADSATDTLTFSAGSGITITTNASTDTMTITAASASFPFAQEGDFASVTDSATTTEDLGDLDSTNATTYDLGTIISAEGLIYPGQLILPQYDTASLPTPTVEAQLAYDTDTNSVKFTNGTEWTGYVGTSSPTFTGTAAFASLTASGTAVVTGNVTGGNLITGGLVSVTGNVTGGNLVTGGLVSATGNVNAADALFTGTMTAGTIVETSTIRIKENVEPIVGGLDAILNLTGVTYDRKDTRAHEAGLIAEQVNEILPDLVAKDLEGNPSAIQYTKLTAYLVEAVKSLKAEIDELKRKH